VATRFVDEFVGISFVTIATSAVCRLGQGLDRNSLRSAWGEGGCHNKNASIDSTVDDVVRKTGFVRGGGNFGKVE